jgi:ABC-type tungstate transport system substrate-binding protein
MRTKTSPWLGALALAGAVDDRSAAGVAGYGDGPRAYLAHTLGEFGVVLMVGGSIPGETRTIAIAIYDRVQAFDNQAAGVMSALLLALSLLALGVTYVLSGRIGRRRA